MARQDTCDYCGRLLESYLQTGIACPEDDCQDRRRPPQGEDARHVQYQPWIRLTAAEHAVFKRLALERGYEDGGELVADLIRRELRRSG